MNFNARLRLFKERRVMKGLEIGIAFVNEQNFRERYCWSKNITKNGRTKLDQSFRETKQF